MGQEVDRRTEAMAFLALLPEGPEVVQRVAARYMEYRDNPTPVLRAFVDVDVIARTSKQTREEPPHSAGPMPGRDSTYVMAPLFLSGGNVVYGDYYGAHLGGGGTERADGKTLIGFTDDMNYKFGDLLANSPVVVVGGTPTLRRFAVFARVKESMS